MCCVHSNPKLFVDISKVLNLPLNDAVCQVWKCLKVAAEFEQKI